MHEMRGMRDLLERQIDQALGRMPADLVVRNARILNLVTGELRAWRHRRVRQHHRGHAGQLPRAWKRSTPRAGSRFPALSTATCIARARW